MYTPRSLTQTKTTTQRQKAFELFLNQKRKPKHDRADLQSRSRKFISATIARICNPCPQRLVCFP